MGLEETVAGLETLGIESVVLGSGADGAVLVLPEYGRVLGVWPHRRGENALWFNPDFLQSLRIGARDDRWMNPGGDRMWLAPEEEFFPDPASPPPVLDPGRFSRVAEKSGYAMENIGEARAWKSEARVRFRMTRRVRPLDEARLSEAWEKTWLWKAGYEEETLLEVKGESPLLVWLWNLTQVPAGSEVRFPLLKYWGDTKLADLPSGTVELADNCALVSLRGAEPMRIAMSAAEAGIRILCLEKGESGHARLLVKQFEGAGIGERDRPHVECRWGCRDGHGEFSCSSPAISAMGRNRLRWRTSLCAFSGRGEEIRAFASRISA